MKIALLGSAPSSIGKAPFQNTQYDEWTAGKVPSERHPHGFVAGDFDIWGCSPGAWAVSPRANRWFEVHRWEPGQPWFSPEYCDFLAKFKGPVYTGARVDDLPTHVVYPIDRLEEKFSSYFMTSSLSLMLALAIDTIEQLRAARQGKAKLPDFVDEAELKVEDSEDLIGMWGVDMAASDEYAYQRPGCIFFLLEAMRRNIPIYLPPESDLLRPLPVYGISEWDANYIKLTARARELSAKAAEAAKLGEEAKMRLAAAQSEQNALNYFVSTWTSPYGMMPGMIIRQEPGTGLGTGITSFDARPVSRMQVGEPAAPAPEHQQLSEEDQRILLTVKALQESNGPRRGIRDPLAFLRTLTNEANAYAEHCAALQPYSQAGESTLETIYRLEGQLAKSAVKPSSARRNPKRRR